MKIIKAIAEDLECRNCNHVTQMYLNRDNMDGQVYTEYSSGDKNTDDPENMFTADSMPIHSLHWTYYADEGLVMYIEFVCAECNEWTEVEVPPTGYTLEVVEK